VRIRKTLLDINGAINNFISKIVLNKEKITMGEKIAKTILILLGLLAICYYNGVFTDEKQASFGIRDELINSEVKGEAWSEIRN